MQNTDSQFSEVAEDMHALASEQAEREAIQADVAAALPCPVSLFTWRFVDNDLRVSLGADMMRLRLALSYVSTLSGEEAAEEAFHVTNAPSECLDATQLSYLGNYKGPSLSVGDYALIGENVYRCASQGWELLSLADLRQALTVEMSSRARWA